MKYRANHYQIKFLWLRHLNCLRLKQSMCGTERHGEIVDNLKSKERRFILHRPVAPGYHQHETDCKRTQLQALPVSSKRYTGEESAPGWWFCRFDPVWGPFIQRLCRQKKVTSLEFERAASQVPGLTHIEKTIAMSAFHHQQKHGSVPLHNATSFL
jgi:hypothetical protein